MKTLIPVVPVTHRILFIRAQKVLLDIDLATLYGVTTKRLNEQVKRNRERFPIDFMFQLSSREKKEVVANCDHLRPLKYSPVRPYAFTEHGAIMMASVLNSPRAVQSSLQVVRAFVKIRDLLSSHKELAQKILEMEKNYDEKFKVVFNAIRELMKPPPKPKSGKLPPIPTVRGFART